MSRLKADRNLAFGPRGANCRGGLSVFVAMYRRGGVPAKMANQRIGAQLVRRRFRVTPETLQLVSAFIGIDPRTRVAECIWQKGTPPADFEDLKI